jgi:hypothetical protein
VKKRGLLRDEVKKELKRLRTECLYDLCTSINTIRLIKSIRMRWAVHVAHVGERRDAYRVLLLGRPWLRWEYNVKIGFQKV